MLLSYNKVEIVPNNLLIHSKMVAINRMPEYGEVLIVVTSNNKVERIIISEANLLQVMWYLYDKQLIIGIFTAWMFAARRVVVRATYPHFDDVVRYLTKYAI